MRASPSSSATGTSAANRIAADADLVIGIGTRYSDFTTGSRSVFQHADVRFLNVNVSSFDAYKHGTQVPLIATVRPLLGVVPDRASLISWAYRGMGGVPQPLVKRAGRTRLDASHTGLRSAARSRLTRKGRRPGRAASSLFPR